MKDPFVEVHARSAFSWLRGGSLPEHLAQACVHLDFPEIGMCDRNGVYGSVRLHTSGKENGTRAIVGCELEMEDETVVPVLVATAEGYTQLTTMLTTAHLRAAKNEARVKWSELAEQNAGLIALTGDEFGPLRSVWAKRGEVAAAESAQRLLRIFGRVRLYAELQRHLVEGENDANEFIVDWAKANGVPLLASNGALYAQPEDRIAADVLACLREHTTLDLAGRRLAPNAERYLKSAKQMGELFPDHPDAIANTYRLARRIEFTLADLQYQFPEYPVSKEETMPSFLRKIAFFGAQNIYGSVTAQVRNQLDRELKLVCELGFAGYFLVVWDLCTYARQQGILCQGRGSAANSALCYVLGITAIDPIACRLLFERFLSEGRCTWPDIDLDFPSDTFREKVIQYVYAKYGKRGAAMTATVSSFRGKSTMRETGKVLGIPDDVLDRFSSLYHHGDYPETMELTEQLRMAGITESHPRLPALVRACQRIFNLPRHLGQHTGGMVISAGRLDRCVPLENARMPDRVVMQWDKEDLEDMHMIKIDLLGLGMMAVLQESLEIARQRGKPVDLARIDKEDPKVFQMMQEADTVGVFQIESRAQMATLPRMKPKTFYDVAIEVALIRPGPIQGGAVNPYLERRAGRQEVTYPHPKAIPILERTLGVVLFQEQILSLAMVLAGFSAAEADELRRAIGFKRTDDRMKKMQAKLGVALRSNGLTEEAARYIEDSLESFALYGFPESHALSFGLIAYASTWLKVHRPAEFFAALLNNQPMGFYSPATLVQDGKRHAIRFLPPCVVHSDALCRVDSDSVVRLGILNVKGLKAANVEMLVAERTDKPFSGIDDFLRRTRFSPIERRALAESGALNAVAEHRRAALWHVESAEFSDDLFRWAQSERETESPLPRMTLRERMTADFTTLQLTTGAHPMAYFRPKLPHGVRASDLKHCPSGQRVTVAGSVITRQRPGTAKGVCFITLEDETGQANAIVYPDRFEANRLIINLEPALMITGPLQNVEGVIHVTAEKIERLPVDGVPEQASHDYH